MKMKSYWLELIKTVHNTKSVFINESRMREQLHTYVKTVLYNILNNAQTHM